MKPKNLKFSIVLILILIWSSCYKSDDYINGEIKIKDFNYTGCKNEIEKSADTELIRYNVTDDNFLSIKHENVWFNCCPRELITNIKLDSTTIIFTEDEKESNCDCICRYDLECKIGPLQYGEYLFVLKRDTRTRIEFNFLFNSSTNNIFTVNNPS